MTIRSEVTVWRRFFIGICAIILLISALHWFGYHPFQRITETKKANQKAGTLGPVQGSAQGTVHKSVQKPDAKPVVYTFDNGWNINTTVCSNLDLKSMPRTPLLHIIKPMEIYTFNPKADAISASIKAMKMFDAADFNVMYHHFGNDTDAHFIDIGANLGIHTLKMAEIGKRTFGVEISYECVQRLCASARFNNLQDKIVLIHNAIGADHKDLKYIKTKENFGFNFVEGDHSKKVMEGTFGKGMFNGIPIVVKSTTLDDVLKNPHFTGIKSVFIKLDVEGFEHKVIEGSDNFFKNVKVKGLYMEWNKQGSFKTGEYIVNKMQSRGYEAFLCDNAKKITCKLLTAAQLKTKVYNILWLPKKAA